MQISATDEIQVKINSNRNKNQISFSSIVLQPTQFTLYNQQTLNHLQSKVISIQKKDKLYQPWKNKIKYLRIQKQKDQDKQDNNNKFNNIQKQKILKILECKRQEIKAKNSISKLINQQKDMKIIQNKSKSIPKINVQNKQFQQINSEAHVYQINNLREQIIQRNNNIFLHSNMPLKSYKNKCLLDEGEQQFSKSTYLCNLKERKNTNNFKAFKTQLRKIYQDETKKSVKDLLNQKYQNLMVISQSRLKKFRESQNQKFHSFHYTKNSQKRERYKTEPDQKNMSFLLQKKRCINSMKKIYNNLYKTEIKKQDKKKSDKLQLVRLANKIKFASHKNLERNSSNNNLLAEEFADKNIYERKFSQLGEQKYKQKILSKHKNQGQKMKEIKCKSLNLKNSKRYHRSNAIFNFLNEQGQIQPWEEVIPSKNKRYHLESSVNQLQKQYLSNHSIENYVQ